MVASGYGLVLIAAMATSAVVTFAGRSAATRTGLLDHPSRRKLHRMPVPVTGGLGILGGLLAGGWVATTRFQVPLPEPAPTLTLAGAAFAIFLLGTIDDRWRLAPRRKLVAQIAICAIAASRGLSVTHLPAGLGDVPLGVFGIVLATAWMVGMVNAINLIDGLDGLAAGIAGLAFVALAAVAASEGPAFLGPLSVLVVGAVLGFLPFNLSRQRTFLGDGGSHLLGFLLAAVPLLAIEAGGTGSSWLVCMGFTAIPILDVGTTIARRRRQRIPIFRADAWHIHHRLLWLGLGPRATLLALLGLSVGFGLLAVAWVAGWGVVPLSVVGLFAVGLVVASRTDLRFLATAADVGAFVFLARRPRNAARRFARDLRPIRESNPALR